VPCGPGGADLDREVRAPGGTVRGGAGAEREREKAMRLSRLALYFAALPADLLCWAAVLAARVFIGGRLRLTWDGLWLVLPDTPSTIARWWPTWGGVTLGHGGLRVTGRRLRWHEGVHVEQFEGAMVMALWFACGQLAVAQAAGAEHGPVLALAVWTMGGALAYAAAVVVAVLRGEDAYLGNVLEEAAYAMEDKERADG